MPLLDIIVFAIASVNEPQLLELRTKLINLQNANINQNALNQEYISALNAAKFTEETNVEALIVSDVLICAMEKYPQLAFKLLESAEIKNCIGAEPAVLRSAAENAPFEIIEKLLAIDKVKENITARDGFGYNALSCAVQYGRTDVVAYLLRYEAVREDAAGFRNVALHLAASDDYVEIVKMLLENEKVVDIEISNGHEVLIEALSQGRKEVARAFFAKKAIRESFPFNDILNDAVVAGKIEAVELLLEGDGVRRVDLRAVAEAKKLGFDKVVNLVLPFVKIEDMPLNRIFKPEIIAALLTHPSYDLDLLTNSPKQFINSFPADSFVSPVVLPILNIIDAHERVKEAERIYRQSSETAMSGRVLNAAKVTFSEAKEKYGAQYNSICAQAGGERQGIEKLERDIRALILDKIREELSGPTANVVRHFIDVNRRELITGKDETLMSQARIYFSSNTDNNHVAWRGYDKWAPIGGEWPNLLTENDQLTPVYAAGLESGVGTMPIETASLDARRRVAFYYLALIDDKIEATRDQKTREGVFIGQLAEIRRAHNFDGSLSEDDPSCYPGTVGRIVNMGVGHPQLHIVDPLEEIPNIIRGMLAQHLDKMTQEMDAKEKEKVYWAMVALTSETMKAYIAGKEIETPIPEAEWVRLREVIINGLGSVDEVFQRINADLSQRDKPKVRLLAEDEKIYVGQQLVDIAFKGVSLNVAEKYEPMMKKAEEGEQVEEIEEVDIEDPFWAIVPKNALNRMQVLKGPDTESKLTAMRQYSADFEKRQRQNEIFKSLYALVKNNVSAKEGQENAVAFFIKVVAEKQAKKMEGKFDRNQISSEILIETVEEFNKKYKKFLSPTDLQGLTQQLSPVSVKKEEERMIR